MYPIFDDESTGIIFSAAKLPVKKLGMVYCLNRPTSIYYVKVPLFEKDKVSADDYFLKLSGDNYLAMMP